ncbi:MAG: SPOR domain-containing protein [Deltaproteobacteria bacterium]|nr:SPOR domain-containing protein [Deltaproteobacteria bacterium]
MARNRTGRGDGTYYMSRRQMIFLAGGFAVTSLIVFFLGVLIGQGIEERKLLKKEEPFVKIPVEPLLRGSAGAAAGKDEITFYDTLAKASKGGQAARSEKEKTGEREVKPAAEAAKPAPRRAPSGGAEKAPAKAEAGVWAVQVHAFPQAGDANRLAKQLKDKGYDAYVVSTTIRGKTWHRVRVGHLATRAGAKALQEELKVKENLTQTMTVGG